MRTPLRPAPHGARPLLAAACAAAAAAAATAAAATAPAAAQTPTAAARTAALGKAVPAPAHVVTVTARDYAFEMPDTLVAGRTELRLANQGADLHHAWLVRLDRAHTAAEFFAAVRQTGRAPEWAQQVGGPNTPAPGGTSAAVLDLAPGNYLVLCGVPADNGQPHLRLGMLKAFTVVPATAATTARLAGAAKAPPAPARAPDNTITLTDQGFALAAPLTAGRHLVRVRNQGAQVHEVLVARLAAGATAEQALAWYETKRGAAPMTAAGGAVGLARGESNDIVLDLAPGQYALLCRQPDVRGERAATHRMVQQITVQ